MKACNCEKRTMCAFCKGSVDFDQIKQQAIFEALQLIKKELPSKVFPCGCPIHRVTCNNQNCNGAGKEYGDGRNQVIDEVVKIIDKHMEER